MISYDVSTREVHTYVRHDEMYGFVCTQQSLVCASIRFFICNFVHVLLRLNSEQCNYYPWTGLQMYCALTSFLFFCTASSASQAPMIQLFFKGIRSTAVDQRLADTTLFLCDMGQLLYLSQAAHSSIRTNILNIHHVCSSSSLSAGAFCLPRSIYMIPPTTPLPRALCAVVCFLSFFFGKSAGCTQAFRERHRRASQTWVREKMTNTHREREKNNLFCCV